MKKFYAFILSLMLCAAASAQGLTLSVDGVNVSHGTDYVRVYNVEAFDKVPGMPFLGQNYGFYPEIVLTSHKAQDVVVTVTDLTHDEGSQFCFGGTCDELFKMGYQSNKVVTMQADKAENMLIHVVHLSAATAPYEVKFQIDAYGTLDNNRITSTVTLKYDPNATDAVQHVTAGMADAPYYTMGGVRVQGVPAPGIYVRGGRKVVVR